MPIEMSCPFCQKAYKLKDELAGKKVTCANVACRRAFQVTGAAPIAKGPAAKTAPDRDAEALAALNDDPANAPQEIEMTCVSCDHVWTVGLDMQGKNVLCPDCRHRQKVPIMKDGRRDWRVKEGAPSLAKQEKLEGVQASDDVVFVSGDTLRKTGVIREEFEPRSLQFWFLAIGGPLIALALLATVVFTWRTNRHETRLEQFLVEANKQLEESQDLPPAEAPLFRAALRIAAGEFSIYRNEPAGLKEALSHFTRARQELETAPSSVARDMLLAELAVTTLHLGGTGEQIEAQQRIRWTAAPAGTSRARLNEKSYDVQSEVIAVLKLLRRDDRPAPVEARMYALRRLTRELIQLQQTDWIEGLIAGTTFFENELIEARSQTALELFLHSGQADKAREVVESLKLQIQGMGPAPFQAIGLSLEPPLSGVGYFKLPGGGDLSDGPRQTFTMANMLQKKPDDALAVAKRGGQVESRLRALAWLAETLPEPLPALEAAQEAVNPASKGPAVSEFILARLAIQARRANQLERFDHFAKAIKDERVRVWASGEGVRQAMQSAGSAPALVEESLLELPQDPKDYRVGHAWGRLAMARNNARVTGQSGPDVVSNFDRWGKGSFTPFGLMGLAIGIQDRTRSGATP